MSPRKLTAVDKQEILRLYQETAETTSTLAERFGVSSSTISRFLKQNLSESDYESLIQQKRLGRSPQRSSPDPADIDPSTNDSSVETTASSPTNVPSRRRRSRSAKDQKNQGQQNATTEVDAIPAEPDNEQDSGQQDSGLSSPTAQSAGTVSRWPITKTSKNNEELDEDLDDDLLDAELDEAEVDVITLEEMLGEDISDDDDDDDLDDFEEDWEETEEVETAPRRHDQVTVLPLSQASFPRTAYLVIDPAANLIVRPLKDFRELGHIPEAEVQQRTLPVFDNQKVARRFSNRSQRVIKVPDCSLFERTSHYLQEKGITRLLLDGQVYSLASDD